MESKCHICKAVVEGEDMGDIETWLTFYCECGHSWGEDRGAEFADRARQRYKEVIHDTL